MHSQTALIRPCLSAFSITRMTVFSYYRPRGASMFIGLNMLWHFFNEPFFSFLPLLILTKNPSCWNKKSTFVPQSVWLTQDLDKTHKCTIPWHRRRKTRISRKLSFLAPRLPFIRLYAVVLTGYISLYMPQMRNREYKIKILTSLQEWAVCPHHLSWKIYGQGWQL